MKTPAIAAAAPLLALAALPLLLHSDFWLHFAIMTLYLALLGQAWNLLGGYGGQRSFGHAAFFGTGAYAAALLQLDFAINPWACMVLAGGFGAGAGALVGALSFRYGLRGSYFALVTLAFAEVFRIVADSVPFTGAGVGLQIALKESVADFQFPEKSGFYAVILALTAIATALAWWIENSRFGAALVAVRENEDAARALGIDVDRTKLWAITLSGALSGCAGSFYVQYFLYLDPRIAYGVEVSVTALLVPLIGGVGTVLGPLVGALALRALNEASSALTGGAPGLNLVLYGALLIVILALLPDGLISLGTRLRRAGRLRALGRA
ncbi:MAG TPA: branched-chain amino acid ABC transporter permease [Alphaproteobacteria bacterium]|nr:branched-chain amino acid ABC transporter permease [Alphaproteobacteria bacterium]